MQTFLDLLRRYLPLLVPAFALGTAAFLLALFILSRRGRNLTAAWKLWLFVSAEYLSALLFILVLRGGEGFGGMYSVNFELFYGYKSLAQSYDAHAFINELMNILIFLPFGFLFTLPFGESRRRFWVIPLGALASLLVETLQFATQLGIFDVDDIFNNTLGTLCGFALARCVTLLRAGRKGPGALALVLTLVCLSPPFAAVAAYSLSPYGVSAFDHVDSAPITGEISFSDEAKEFIESLALNPPEIYAAERGSLESARCCAAEFFARFGETIGSEDLYDESAWFRSSGGQRTVIYRYNGCSVEYTDYEAGDMLRPDMDEQDVRAAALSWGVEIPPEAEFASQGQRYVFTVNPPGDTAGRVKLEYRRGSVTIDYALYALERTASAKPLSLDECVTALRRGDYACWDERPDGGLHIDGAKLSYELDSKGLYRPALTLACGDAELHIPLGPE